MVGDYSAAYDNTLWRHQVTEERWPLWRGLGWEFAGKDGERVRIEIVTEGNRRPPTPEGT